MLTRIKSRFALDWWGHHGVRHWARVRGNARIIAKHVDGVDTQVTDLFAVLHDAWRADEFEDPGHGGRAMAWVRRTHAQDRLGLTPEQFHTLLIAIERHSNQRPLAYNVTMAACWNADRLDLGRVGITPEKRLLYPEALPPDHIIEAMHQRAMAERHKQRTLHAHANLLPPRNVHPYG